MPAEGPLFPVVCAAPLSKEVTSAIFPPPYPWLNTNPWRGLQVMNRFIEENDVDDSQWNLVFVDSIDDCYNETSEAPVEEESDPNSPFIGKTPEECRRLLCKLQEDTESEIMPDLFVIMDERSTEDDTVLLACVDANPEGEFLGVATVRATFETAAFSLIIYEVGKSSVGEDAERARLEGDGVFRGYGYF